MEFPLIPAQNTLAIWAALAGIVAFGLWSEKTVLGRRLTGVIVVLIGAFLLSNIGLIPHEAAAYSTVMSQFVPLSLALLLFRVDLKSLRKESAPTFIIFGVGVAGVVLGAVTAYFLVPVDGPKAELAGMFAATYIGGSANFAAVGTALGVSGGDFLVPAAAADTIVTIVYLLILGALPGIRLARAFFASPRTTSNNAPTESAPGGWLDGTLNLRATMFALFLAFVIVSVSGWVQSLVEIRGVSIVMITVFAVAAATLAPSWLRPAEGPFQLGMILMLMFFAALGASGDIPSLIASGPSMFIFAGAVIGVHFVVIFGVGKLLKLDLAEIATASNACVCGPPTAAGMAADAGWDHMVTPGILVGSLGFAIASLVGVGVAGALG